MAKRKPLSFDSDTLAKDLKESVGKGVDAFFSPSPAASAVDKTRKDTKIALPPASLKTNDKSKKDKPIPSDKRSNEKESTQESRNLDTYVSRYLSRNLDIYLDYLRPYLLSSGIQVNFNYPQELINKFDDLMFELNRRLRQRKQKQKLTKTKVLVAALAYIIWDYETRKDESILRKLIEKEND